MVGTIDENGNVFGDVKELIFREHHLHVRENQRIKVDQNVYTHVLGNVQHNCEGWVGYYVDKIFAVKTDGKIALDAGEHVEITVGGNGIIINKYGVQIVGLPSLQLNSSFIENMPIDHMPPVDPVDPDR